jgi:hypothetical protein
LGSGLAVKLVEVRGTRPRYAGGVGLEAGGAQDPRSPLLGFLLSGSKIKATTGHPRFPEERAFVAVQEVETVEEVQ